MMSKWQNIALDWSFFVEIQRQRALQCTARAHTYVYLLSLSLPPSLSLSLLHSHMGTFPLKWEENDSVFFFLSKVDFELKHKNVRKSEGVRREREERERWDWRERDASFFYWIFYFFTKEWWQTGGTIWQLVVVLQRGPGLTGSWVRVPSNERRVAASLSLSLSLLPPIS